MAMKIFPFRLLVTALALALLAGPAAPAAAQSDAPSPSASVDWPQWRGPLATGAAPAGDPPSSWSETENVRWKIEIPGYGQASPIVWGDRVFILTAIPAGPGDDSGNGFFARLRRRFMGTVRSGDLLNFVIVALDRRDGSVVWERTAVTEQPHEGRHNTGSWASGSAVTDGEVVCAFFGSRGLHCYDMDGTPLWDRDFGDMRIRMGFGEGPRRRCTAARSSSSGTTRGSRSSRRSTSAPGPSCGAPIETRAPRGRRRSSSSTPAAPRWSPARRTACAATTSRPASSSGKAKE